MPIEAGQQLLHYRLIDKIGEGGMGVVWRGRDTRLDRDVAIKVLPDEFAQYPDRLARFEREAKLLASLNHDNIATIHGLEQTEGVQFLAMELVEGEDLTACIGRGAIPIEEALPLALQMANALEAAHEQGVIHRDLKPANARVTPDGKLKVLDFGLAKAMAPDTTDTATNTSLSPTITSTGTLAGTILGTAAYMSPEQASGRPVDRRADIWAFGVVLLEMLSGRTVFAGDTVSHVLASVLKDEADLGSLPADTPGAVRRLLHACLQKKPRRRLQSIGDARVILEDVLEGREVDEPSAPATGPRHTGLLVGAALVIVAVVAGLVGWFVRPAVESAPVSRLSVTMPDDAMFEVDSYPGRAIDISPDGSMIVFGTHEGLRVRRLDALESRLLPDTVDGNQPKFSPDGKWVAFFSELGLRKIPVEGGRPVTILPDLPNGPWLQMDWAEDGTIVFDTWNAGLRRVSADGGAAEVLTEPTDEWNLDPQFLPGGEDVLYFVQGGAGSFRIEAIPTLGGTPTRVLDNASHPRFLKSGHLLFMRDGLLMVAAFDRSELEVTGRAAVVPVEAMVDHVNVAAPLPQLAVSDNGTLVYAPDRNAGNNSATLARIDRSGKEIDTFEVPFRRPHFSISPDGTRIAISGRDGADALTYVLDVERKTLTQLLTEKTDYASMTLWAPDGSGLYFARYGTHECELWFQPIEGGAPRKLVTQAGTWSSPSSVSSDGRYVIYFSYDTETLGSIWYLDMQSGEDVPAAETLGIDGGTIWPMISPDSRWIAYQTWTAGLSGVHVRRFPDGGSEQRVVAEETAEGRWSPDGRELYYRTLDDAGVSTIKVVSVTTEPALRFGDSRVLFSGRFQSSADSGLSIAVWPDGESLLLVREEWPDTRARELIVVQNWLEEIQEIAP